MKLATDILRLSGH